MRFEVNGKVYALEFSRDQKVVDAVGKDAPLSKIGKPAWSKHPYTTATLYEVLEGKSVKEWPIVAEAEVGCNPLDKFTLEGGRLAALKKLSGYVETRNGKTVVHPSLIPSELKIPMWQVYLERPRQGKQTMKALRLENERLKAQLKSAQETIQRLTQETE